MKISLSIIEIKRSQIRACHQFSQMTAATQWIAPRKARLAYRSGWRSPGTALIWQRSFQSGAASGTCLGRTPRGSF